MTPDGGDPTIEEVERIRRELRHAENAVAELRSILRRTQSDDVRETIRFAIEAWEQRASELSSRLEQPRS